MIRRPKYLDEDILYELADYLGLESPESRDVRRTTHEGRDGRAGIRSPVDLAISKKQADEIEESFSVPVRPTQLLSEVLNGLTAENLLVDLGHDPSAAIPHRAAVEVPGKLSLSPVSEIATLFEMLLPLLLQSGDDLDLDAVPPDQVARVLFDRRDAQAPVVMTLDPNVGPYRFAMVLRPECLRRIGSFEELEGEFTVFGTLDGPLGEEGTISLEKYMLPGLPRVVRRAIGQKGMTELLDGLAQTTGRHLEVADLSFVGPGGLLSVAAIYP